MSRVRAPFLTPIFLNRAPVAQLDRATDFESAGRGFESLQACQLYLIFYYFSVLYSLQRVADYKNGPLAQLVEHLTLNQGVTGSRPVWPTILFCESGGIGRRARLRI
jgi:hypothetical protein